MKLKLFAIFTLSVFLFNTALIAQNRVRPRAVINTAEIVSLLPASDAVAVIDVKRFLNTALPQMLSGNQQMLAEVTRGLDEAKTKTGIDFRQFDIVTAGFTAIKVKEKEYDFDSVIIARGQIKAGALIAAATYEEPKGAFAVDPAGRGGTIAAGAVVGGIPGFILGGLIGSSAGKAKVYDLSGQTREQKKATLRFIMAK